MAQTVRWLPRPEKHDFQAAEDYLSLLMPPKQAAGCRRRLTAARDDITHRKAEDILRASQLPLLGDAAHPLIVADGYHRVCASYWIDENTDIPCVLVDA
jgi:hypothetical protein